MNAISTNRREFLGSAGLVIGLALPMKGMAAETAGGSAAPFAPNAFVRIAADDSVMVIIKHVEFGQGPATGLATIVADELDADRGQMKIAFAPANDPLYKNLAFGTMGTGGSTAMANSWMQMRGAGASARAMRVQAAAATCRSLRMAEMPAVEVAIITSRENPTGIGEPGLPPIAPAVANAWRTLTGKSVRRLPFAHQENVA